MSRPQYFPANWAWGQKLSCHLSRWPQVAMGVSFAHPSPLPPLSSRWRAICECLYSGPPTLVWYWVATLGVPQAAKSSFREESAAVSHRRPLHCHPDSSDLCLVWPDWRVLLSSSEHLLVWGLKSKDERCRYLHLAYLLEMSICLL